MPVINGQSVSAEVTNPAFLDAQVASTGVGVVTLAATSSTTISDVQGSINVLVSGVGGNQSTPATSYGSIPANTIVAGSDHLTALIALANKLDNSTGHTHDGTQGDGGPLSAVTSIAVSGGSPNIGDIILSGIGLTYITDLGAGVIQISGATPTIQEVLDAGNQGATAGIDFDGGAIAGLSYCEYVEITSPPFSPASGYLMMYALQDDLLYKKTSAGVETAIETTVAVSGSTALRKNVTFSSSGGITLTQSGQNIQIFSSTGTSGVTTFAASGQSGLTGAVTISGGSNIALTQASQNVSIAVSGVIPSANIGLNRTINSVTGTSYTFVLGDGLGAGAAPLVVFTSGSAVTATVPPASSVAYAVGTQIDLIQTGAGKVTLAQGAGVTINSKSSNKAVGAQYVGVTLVQTASNVWNLMGDLQA